MKKRESPGDILRDRIKCQGVGSLTVEELFGLMLGGTEKHMDGARMLLRRFDGNLARMAGESCQTLALTPGMSFRDGCHAAAALELARRWAAFLPSQKMKFQGPEHVANFLRPSLRGAQQEMLWAMCLDTKNVITHWKMLTVGTLNASLIHPREVYRYAIENASAGVILAHNHPSGDPTPSPEDINVTRRIAQAGKLLDIPLLDHVIVADNSFRSLKEDGHLR